MTAKWSKLKQIVAHNSKIDIFTIVESNTNIIKLRFFGNEISPESFTSKELGDLLVTFYEGIKSLIEERFAYINSDSIGLSLVSIENKSQSLSFAPDQIKGIDEVFKIYGESVEKNTYTDLPKKTYDSIKCIYGITKRKKCNAELVQKGERLFVVTNEDELVEQENVLVKSNMVLYGKLNQLRAEKPRAWIESTNGGIISFSVTDGDILRLRNKLKEYVGFKGEGKWNVITNNIVSFKAKEILEYTNGNVFNGFNKLKNISNGFWDSFDNSSIIDFLKNENK